MQPRELMVLGIVMYAISIGGVFFIDMRAAMVVAVAVGGGLLFGKGYGIWEERQRDRYSRIDPVAWLIRWRNSTDPVTSLISSDIVRENNETAANLRVEMLMSQKWVDWVEKVPLYPGNPSLFEHERSVGNGE